MPVILKTTFCKVLLLVTLFSMLIVGCKPTRFLSEGEYLLKKNKIKVEGGNVDKKELSLYYKQKSNRRLLFMFYPRLYAYNFSKLGKKERKWKNWLKNSVGEEPVVFDSALMERTNLQFKKFLKNKSYYNATVSNRVRLTKKKAKIIYKIKTGKPLIINRIDFKIHDSLVQPLIFADTVNTLLKKGDKLLLKTLQNEQKRITSTMRDSGYYRFLPDYVRYIIDTANNKASVLVDINYALVFDKNNKIKKKPHQKYRVNNIYIFTDYNPQQIISNKKEYISKFDTTKISNYNFIYAGKKNVRPSLILKANSIKPFSDFNNSFVSQTNNHINSLKLFRLHNISFKEDKKNDTLLNCEIQLTPFTYQNYSLNLETTNVQGNVGFGGYVSYQHKNLFKGAEIMSLKLSGSVERQSSSRGLKTRNIFEIGAELRLEIPKFVLPFRMQQFYKKHYPKTIFSASYSRRRKPEQYTRNLFSVSAGYLWRKNKNIENFLYPINISAVTLPEITKAFADTIKGSYLEKNYKDYFILGPRYVITNINSKKNKYKNHSFFRWNIETAGNMVYLLHKNTSIKDTVKGGYYAFFNTQYAQFFKTDVDYRYNNYLNNYSSIVYRVFAGFGIPYGNAQAIPFIRQYSSGGADGMRAWLARDLGPGTYSIPDSINLYPDQYGDVKIEMNVEYRFDIIRSFKGAWFLDIGNIWTLNEVDERQGGEFNIGKFYKQLAVGTGLGLRYDFDFAVLRLDAGIKVRDPSVEGAKTWVLFNRPFEWKHIVFNFGIGYPF